MFFRKILILFLNTGIVFFIAGCAVNEMHPKYKVGQIYEITNDSFVIFRYASFIWQDRRDYQKIGYLYTFEPYPIVQGYQQKIKEKKALEFDGKGNIDGGWTVYIPIGSKFKIVRVYSHIPRIDKTIIIEGIFLDGKIKGKIVKLTPQFQSSNAAKIIK